jgi:hypothetical protein
MVKPILVPNSALAALVPKLPYHGTVWYREGTKKSDTLKRIRPNQQAAQDAGIQSSRAKGQSGRSMLLVTSTRGNMHLLAADFSGGL